MDDLTVVPSPPNAHVRCLRQDCGWYVAGELDAAIEDLERHMVALHDVDPARTRTQPRIEATDSRSIRIWKAAAERYQAQRDNLADEVERLRHITETDKPSTAVTVVHPNDEINAVLEMLERSPEMADLRVGDDTGLRLAEIAARRWRAALKEQAG